MGYQKDGATGLAAMKYHNTVPCMKRTSKPRSPATIHHL